MPSGSHTTGVDRVHSIFFETGYTETLSAGLLLFGHCRRSSIGDCAAATRRIPDIRPTAATNVRSHCSECVLATRSCPSAFEWLGGRFGYDFCRTSGAPHSWGAVVHGGSVRRRGLSALSLSLADAERKYGKRATRDRKRPHQCVVSEHLHRSASDERPDDRAGRERQRH